MKHFLQKVMFKRVRKPLLAFIFDSEIAKTGLNVTANSNIRQITDACG